MWNLLFNNINSKNLNNLPIENLNNHPIGNLNNHHSNDNLNNENNENKNPSYSDHDYVHDYDLIKNFKKDSNEINCVDNKFFYDSEINYINNKEIDKELPDNINLQNIYLKKNNDNLKYEINYLKEKLFNLPNDAFLNNKKKYENIDKFFDITIYINSLNASFKIEDLTNKNILCQNENIIFFNYYRLNTNYKYLLEFEIDNPENFELIISSKIINYQISKNSKISGLLKIPLSVGNNFIS